MTRLPRNLHFNVAKGYVPAMQAMNDDAQWMLAALVMGGSIYGSTNPDNDGVVVSFENRVSVRKVVTNRTRVVAAKTVWAMVNAGWLRFADMGADGGLFWLTDSAKLVLRRAGAMTTHL